MESLVLGIPKDAEELVRYVSLTESLSRIQRVKETIYDLGPCTVIYSEEILLHSSEEEDVPGTCTKSVKVRYSGDRNKSRISLTRKAIDAQVLSCNLNASEVLEAIGAKKRAAREYTRKTHAFRGTEFLLITGNGKEVAVLRAVSETAQEAEALLREAQAKLAPLILFTAPPESTWKILG